MTQKYADFNLRRLSVDFPSLDAIIQDRIGDMWLNSTGFYKWADLENTGFVTMYEEVHGKGSWSEFTKLVEETMVANPWSRRAEFWRYVKEASSPPR